MGKDEKELSDVVIVLVEEIGMTIHDAARKLTEVGLIVSEVDEEEAIVEGTIETEKVGGLKEMVFVKYVRNVFNYVAEESEGDEDDLTSEADDAGA
jgi:hypothetical protein